MAKKNRQTKRKKSNSIPLGFVKEALTLIGGLAGSILAVYGLIKTFKDDAEGFSWLIPVGIVIWIILLFRLYQTRKAAAYSLFIVSMLVGVIGWVGWQSQVEATEKKVVVLVAKFDGPEEKYGLHDQIMEDLYHATSKYDDTIIIDGEDVITAGLGSEHARQLGRKFKADLVIWAWYRPTEDPNIKIHIENLSPEEFVELQESETYNPQATLAELESFEVQRKLGSETSTLVSFLTGVLRLKLGDYNTAIERFESVLTENDISTFVSRYDLFFNLASSYFHLDKYEQASENYGKAIENKPQDAKAYNNRAVTYGALQEYERAIQDLDVAIQLEPNNETLYVNLGNAKGELGQHSEAIKDYSKALEINPQFEPAYFNRGNQYRRTKQYTLAIQDYDKAIQINPEFESAYINRGNCYYDLGDFLHAIEDYDKAIDLDPKDAAAYKNRGLAYGLIGKMKEAQADFKKYEELTGEKP